MRNERSKKLIRTALKLFRLARAYYRIRASGRFDEQFYRRQYPDIVSSRLSPLWHYVRHGAWEGRFPCWGFDSAYYLAANPDVAATGVNPFEHYMRFGEKEGRPTQAGPGTISDGQFLIGANTQLDTMEAALQETRIPESVAHAKGLEDLLGRLPETKSNGHCGVAAIIEGQAVAWIRNSHTNREVTDATLLLDGAESGRGKIKRTGSDRFSILLFFDLPQHPPSGPTHSIAFRIPSTDGSLDFPADALTAYLDWHPTQGRVLGLLSSQILSENDLERRLGETELFDDDWYGRQRGTFNSRRDAIRDYVYLGRFEGFEPHPLMNPRFYFDRRPALAAAGVEMISHYLDYGHMEEAICSPFVTEAESCEPKTCLESRENCRNRLVDRSCCGPGNDQLCGLANFLRAGSRGLPGAPNAFVANELEQLLANHARELTRDTWLNPETRLLFISHEASQTGATMILLQLVRELAIRHHVRSTVIFMKWGEMVADFREFGDVICLTHAQTMEFGTSGFNLLIFSAIRTIQPQAVICNTLETVEAMKLCHCLRLPVIAYVHEDAREYGPEPFLRAFRYADHVFLPSSSLYRVASEVMGCCQPNVIVQPQGLLDEDALQFDYAGEGKTMRRQLNLSDTDFVAITCGSGCLRKGIDHFLGVAGELDRRLEQGRIVLLWIGALVETTAICTARDAERFSGRVEVRFVGPVPSIDVTAYLAAADAYLFLSRYDPYPSAVMEAMAAGLPVVYFAGSTGMGDLLQSAGGIEVNYGDVGVVSQQVLGLMSDSAARDRMGEMNREAISTHDTMSDYANILVDIAGLSTSVPLPSDKRIIVPCINWAISGVNTAIEGILGQLAARGWDVRLVFTGDIDGDMVPAPVLTTLGLEVVDESPREKLARLVSYIESNSPCVVLTSYDFQANGLIPCLSNSVGVALWNQSDEGVYYEQAYRLGLYANRIIAVSDHIRREVSKSNPILADRTVVIHNSSISEKDLFPHHCGTRPIKLIYTGRLVHYQKRIFDFIKLVAELDSHGVDYVLTLVGEPPERDREGVMNRLNTELRGHLLHGKVRLTGRLSRDEVFDELRNHHIFVLLSDFEGFSLSLVEAMGLGCVPIVAEMRSGINEIIVDDENGFVLDTRRYGRWAKLIGDLADDPNRLIRMSQHAIDSVANSFTTEKIADGFETCLSGILDEIYNGYQRPNVLKQSQRTELGDALLPPR